jgi:hypothetical protein
MAAVMAVNARWRARQVPVRVRCPGESWWTDETLGGVEDFPPTPSGKVRKMDRRRQRRAAK